MPKKPRNIPLAGSFSARYSIYFFCPFRIFLDLSGEILFELDTKSKKKFKYSSKAGWIIWLINLSPSSPKGILDQRKPGEKYFIASDGISPPEGSLDCQLAWIDFNFPKKYWLWTISSFKAGWRSNAIRCPFGSVTKSAPKNGKS